MKNGEFTVILVQIVLQFITNNKGNKMRKISKLLVGILFSALVIAPSYAGEMTVTGGATATYATNGADACR